MQLYVRAKEQFICCTRFYSDFKSRAGTQAKRAQIHSHLHNSFNTFCTLPGLQYVRQSDTSRRENLQRTRHSKKRLTLSLASSRVLQRFMQRWYRCSLSSAILLKSPSIGPLRLSKGIPENEREKKRQRKEKINWKAVC
jgi:hypothetical protein